jgi:hypothetical protein
LGFDEAPGLRASWALNAEVRRRKMIDARYKKLTGMHAGHIYKVKAPASEMDSPMRWSLQNEAKADDRLIVSEDDLKDARIWQPIA